MIHTGPACGTCGLRPSRGRDEELHGCRQRRQQEPARTEETMRTMLRILLGAATLIGGVAAANARGARRRRRQAGRGVHGADAGQVSRRPERQLPDQRHRLRHEGHGLFEPVRPGAAGAADRRRDRAEVRPAGGADHQPARHHSGADAGQERRHPGGAGGGAHGRQRGRRAGALSHPRRLRRRNVRPPDRRSHGQGAERLRPQQGQDRDPRRLDGGRQSPAAREGVPRGGRQEPGHGGGGDRGREVESGGRRARGRPAAGALCAAGRLGRLLRHERRGRQRAPSRRPRRRA